MLHVGFVFASYRALLDGLLNFANAIFLIRHYFLLSFRRQLRIRMCMAPGAPIHERMLPVRPSYVRLNYNGDNANSVAVNTPAILMLACLGACHGRSSLTLSFDCFRIRV